MPYAYLQCERERERDLRAKLGVGAAPLAEEVAHAVGGRRAWAEGEDELRDHQHGADGDGLDGRALVVALRAQAAREEDGALPPKPVGRGGDRAQWRS